MCKPVSTRCTRTTGWSITIDETDSCINATLFFIWFSLFTKQVRIDWVKFHITYQRCKTLPNQSWPARSNYVCLMQPCTSRGWKFPCWSQILPYVRWVKSGINTEISNLCTCEHGATQITPSNQLTLLKLLAIRSIWYGLVCWTQWHHFGINIWDTDERGQFFVSHGIIWRTKIQCLVSISILESIKNMLTFKIRWPFGWNDQ